MSSSSAQEQVFSLPELTVAIILQLPLRDILVNAQRVSREWESAVKSAKVQYALYLKPLPSSECVKAQFNPLLEAAFPPWFKNIKRTSAKVGSKRVSRGWQFKELLKWGSSAEACAAYSRKEASWRRMLPVQPPATIFEVVKIEHYQTGSFKEVGEVTFRDGVRMGTLYDLAQKTVAKPISSFEMKWQMFPPLDGEPEDSGEDTPLHEVSKRARGEGPPKVTMRTNYTFQCSMGMRPDVGPEFVSKGYEELDIAFGNETRLR